MLREKLAELCHDQWSGWMEYLFSKGTFLNENEIWEMPSWAIDRWQRQMNTEYTLLSEEEKDSDRREADKFLKIIESEIECAFYNGFIIGNQIPLGDNVLREEYNKYKALVGL